MRNRSLPVLVFCWCLSAAADQNDPKLDQLFEQLKQTEEIEQGELITRQIWEIWYEINDEQATSLLLQGDAFMAQADFRSALIAFTRLTEISPDFAEAWNRKATLLYMMGEYTLSMKDIEQTLKLEPRHFGAISGLGQIYVRLKKPGKARAAFEKALEINPHLIGARVNIMRIDKWLGERAI